MVKESRVMMVVEVLNERGAGTKGGCDAHHVCSFSQPLPTLKLYRSPGIATQLALLGFRYSMLLF